MKFKITLVPGRVAAQERDGILKMVEQDNRLALIPELLLRHGVKVGGQLLGRPGPVSEDIEQRERASAQSYNQKKDDDQSIFYTFRHRNPPLFEKNK